jgi:protein phosphatase
MGTTIVVVRVVLSPTLHATVAHVGDSRVYLLRDGSLSQLTQDHSLIEEYVRRGLIQREMAFRHPLRHVLSRALGLERAAEPDIAVHPLRPHDRLLLCTDGLTKMMDDQQIEAVLTAGERSLEASCEALVDEALRLGGEDNVTVILCSTAARV